MNTLPDRKSPGALKLSFMLKRVTILLFYQLADLAWDTRTADMIRAYALSGTDSEQQLHQLLVDRFGIESTAQPSAVTAAYSAHEKQALETGRYEFALAAMLPCIWIYNRVGLYILGIAKLEGNPYRDWIEAYTREVDYIWR